MTGGSVKRIRFFQEGAMIKLIGYQKCGTCRKAMKWLQEQGIPYEFRDIKLKNHPRTN